ncbi:MAG TPA: DUF6580 family putative transport protein [Verrucomicrobiae bacterium]|nr:DUF6580 family putative transport protein [Verrucomicrobiae bacterium]
MAGLKDKFKIVLPIILMVVLAISMWPGVSEPMARALGLPNGLNFSAAYALAFCAGVYFPKRLKWALPLGMFVVVNILTNLHYGVSPFNRYLFVKIAAFSILIWFGTRFSAKAKWVKLVGGGFASAIIFYIVTNTASWMWDPAYKKDLLGWLQALTIGTPGFPPTITFLLNSLISGGLFTGLFAGAMKLTAADEATGEEPDQVPQAEEAEAEGALPAPEKSEA